MWVKKYMSGFSEKNVGIEYVILQNIINCNSDYSNVGNDNVMVNCNMQNKPILNGEYKHLNTNLPYLIKSFDNFIVTY